MKRRNKYNARRTKVDGITFDSRREAEYYRAYKADEKAGRITDLKLQPRYEFEINGKPLRYESGRKVTARLDFSFKETTGIRRKLVNGGLGPLLQIDCGGPFHVIDVKGFDTPLSKLKRALMKACHGIDVEVVR